MVVRRSVARARARRLLVVVLGCALWSAGLAAPASAQPPVGLRIQDVAGNDIAPFVGEEFFAQSTPRETPGGRDSWVCHVDFGDGATGGYWRAHSYDQYAPCAATHAYAGPGTYTLVMTITDAEGGSVSEQRQLVVEERPVVARDAGVEGRAVTLAGPAGAPAVHWSLRNDAHDNCRITDPTAHDATVACFDEGTYLVAYDTGDAETSGAYAVTWANGAPRPKGRAMRLTLDSTGALALVPTTRVGTGDALGTRVWFRDPSDSGTSGPPYGDRLACRFDHGNGHHSRDTERGDGTCLSYTSYLVAGRQVTTVRTTDGDGGEASVRIPVTVVRRDVHLTARDARGGVRGGIRASLTPRGLLGHAAFHWRDGRSLVARRLTTIEVTPWGSVSLRGRAVLDGKPGYRFDVDIWAKRVEVPGLEMTVRVWRAGQGRVSDPVLRRDIGPRQFAVRLHAPPVR
jgi:hypothetical protein